MAGLDITFDHENKFCMQKHAISVYNIVCICEYINLASGAICTNLRSQSTV